MNVQPIVSGYWRKKSIFSSQYEFETDDGILISMNWKEQTRIVAHVHFGKYDYVLKAENWNTKVENKAGEELLQVNKGSFHTAENNLLQLKAMDIYRSETTWQDQQETVLISFKDQFRLFKLESDVTIKTENYPRQDLLFLISLGWFSILAGNY